MNKSRPPTDPDSPVAAYLRALRWLTARELSEAQVRDRLNERGYGQGAITAAIERLKNERTLDDARAATAVARTEAKVRRHGPRRVMGKLIAMRVDADMAKQIVRDLFGEDEEAALLETAIDRRLRGKPERLKEPDQRRKLLAYLVRQGFPASAAAAVIRKKSRENSQ